MASKGIHEIGPALPVNIPTPELPILTFENNEGYDGVGEVSLNPTLVAALAYAQRGWRVIPLVANSKKPLIKDWRQAASTDELMVHRWFASGKNNLGIVTGPESNVFVLDLDRHRPEEDGTKSFLEICKQISAIAKGPMAITAGGGCHLLFQFPKSAIKIPKQLAPGIDLLGAGRFFVASPSAINGKYYRWEKGCSPPEIGLSDCTDWLEAAMALRGPPRTSQVIALQNAACRGTAAKSKAISTVVDLSRNSPETPENIEKLRFALNAIPPCIERKDWINILFSVKAHGFSCGEMLARKWSATCAEKYNDADFTKDWASDKGHGIGSGTVYYVANQYIKTDKQPDEGMFIDAVGDITNGREFARHFKGKLLYCHAASKWLYWDNQRWVWCDTGSQMQYAKQIADQMLEDAAKAFKQAPNDGNTKIVVQAAKSLHGNEKRLMAMLSMASSEDTMSIATPAGLDSNPWLLGVRNGTVDLRSGKLLPSDPSMLISKQCNAPFNKQATCPRFQQFMRDVFQGDQVMIDYVQRQLGYAITGQVTEEVMFFWFGRGANGKSVLVNIIAGVMGGYTGQVSPDLLRAGREAKGSAERATVRLTGLRMVLMNELAEGETWDDGKLREITSREKIAARFLYGEAFDFVPTHKLFVRGNNKPAIRDGTDGTWRRLHLVSFDRQFTENERITDLDTQILDAERDGILQWLIEGCLAWQKHGLNPPAKVRDAVQIYRKDCDVLSEWMECNCVEGSDSCADKKATYQSYKAWSDENSIRPLSGKAFSRRLSERGFKIDAGRRNYMGFKLNAIALTPMGLGQYG